MDTRSTGVGARCASRRQDSSRSTSRWISIWARLRGQSENRGTNCKTAATSIKKKGLVDATAQKMMTRFLESLGYKEVVLKSDGERSLVKMKMEAAKKARGLRRALPEEWPAGGSCSNGEAEAAVKEVKWRCKANLLSLDKKLDGGVPEGRQGRSRWEEIRGEKHREKWVKAMPEFGEKSMVKPGHAQQVRVNPGDDGCWGGRGHTGSTRVPCDIKKYVNQQQIQKDEQAAVPLVVVAGAPRPEVEPPEEHHGR